MDIIKEWFNQYYLHNSDITFDFSRNGRMIIHNNVSEPWKVTLVDTGLHTMTGGRIKRIKEYIGHETFMMTYGDGVSDVNINQLLSFHTANKKIVTMTAVQQESRFGVLDIGEKNVIRSFREKSRKDSGWINAGYMVLEPQIFEYIDDDSTIFEKEPLEKIARKGELVAYQHDGFWQCMDTQRDKQKLEELWEVEAAPWKKW